MPPVRQLGRGLADAFLPRHCLLCGQADTSANLCPACQQDLPALNGPHCPSCLEVTTHGERCGACLARPPHFDAVLALYAYAFPVDQLIHALKYHARFALAQDWGHELAMKLKQGKHPAIDRILPLPLHPERLAERGYNQSQEIARHLAAHAGLRLDSHSLEKIHATRSQAELRPKERRQNIHGAFACNTDLSGRTLLLVDDVLTTGATLDEAARTLKLHGALAVLVAVVARTPRH